MNHKLIEAGVAMILDGLGCDPDTDHNFADTPKRVAEMYKELFQPPDTGWPVFDEAFTDMVLMRRHTFYTLCPHHMAQVEIRASVAYMPNGKVIGASKLLRMIAEASDKPYTQEFLTYRIVEKIRELTQGTSRGEAVLLIGEHGCFRMRGVKSHDAQMVTVKFGGEFEKDQELQRRFFDLVKL